MARPNIARIYDALCGGKDNLAADRQLAARLAAAQPLMRAGARANRAFLRRAVTFLARTGIDQLLDVGCGLPTRDSLGQVSARTRPETKVVHVDNDPIVLAYARALLADPARSVVVDGDVREPEKILTHPDLQAHLDLTRPVAVVLGALLHFVTPDEDPARIVATFRETLTPGSALVITHVVDDGGIEGVDAATRAAAEIYTEAVAPVVVRTREQVGAWFDGFRLLPPGLVTADTWRRTGSRAVTASAPIVAGVGVLDGPGRGKG